MKVVEDFESRPHRSSVLVWSRETRRYRNGMNRRCRRCFQASVEEGCQRDQRREEEAEKKRRRRRRTERDQVRYEIAPRSGCGHQGEGKRA